MVGTPEGDAASEKLYILRTKREKHPDGSIAAVGKEDGQQLGGV